jgi:multidrug efflux pump subunit AcrA (membrane-fusion protein)
MKKVILLVVVLAVITVGWFLYFNQSDPLTEVSIAEAKIMDLGNTLEFSGQVTPVHIYNVMSETGGTVNTLCVSEGDEVSAGDTLFCLDASVLQTQLEEAQLQYDILSDAAAQAVMAQDGAISDAERSLQEQQIKVALALSQTTGYDFDSFNAAFADTAQDAASEMAASLSGMALDDLQNTSVSTDTSIEDQLALAALSIQSLEDAIAKMSVSSLIDGTVIAVNIHEGEVLAPGVPALIIANTRDTVVEGYIYEKDVADLAEGQRVKIYTDEGYYWGTLTAIGKAAGVGDTSDYGTMTKVQVTPDGAFSKMPGAIVDLEIVISSKNDVLSVPLECITDDDCIFVVDAEGNAEKRIVQTGFTDMYYAEIISGVSAGEQVILSPHDIEEGQQVVYD